MADANKFILSLVESVAFTLMADKRIGTDNFIGIHHEGSLLRFVTSEIKRSQSADFTVIFTDGLHADTGGRQI